MPEPFKGLVVRLFLSDMLHCKIVGCIAKFFNFSTHQVSVLQLQADFLLKDLFNAILFLA